MLLHTIDWWPQNADGSGKQTRERLAHLFPVATLEGTAHALVADHQWTLCRQLYDHVVYRQVAEGGLSREGVLALSVANVRLTDHLWPAAERGLLSAALSAVTEFAMGRRLTRKGLHLVKGEVARLLDGRGTGSTAIRESMEAVVALLRAGVRSRSDSDLARHAVRVLGHVEAAAMHAVPEGRALGRATAIAGARAEVWQSAFLYLDLTVAGSRVHSVNT